MGENGEIPKDEESAWRARWQKLGGEVGEVWMGRVNSFKMY